jgi:hypothetical protein
MTCQTIDMKTLILGLGNPILRDDGVGLRVAQALRPMLAEAHGVEVDENTWGGLRLMERLVGYDRVIVVHRMTPAFPWRWSWGGGSACAFPRAPTSHWSASKRWMSSILGKS